MILDYFNTYTSEKIIFHASDIVMWVDSDADFLIKQKAKIHITGFYHMITHPTRKTPTIKWINTCSVQDNITGSGFSS